MPLYEYVCERCAHQFEELVSADVTPPCPRCQAPRPHRVMSVVAVGRAGGQKPAAPPPGACGTCGDPRGPGACSMS